MRRFLAASLLLLLAGCGDKAKDLHDTAQLEEKQFNKPHATKLYRQIVEEYPDSGLRESGEDSFGGVGESALDIRLLNQEIATVRSVTLVAGRCQTSLGRSWDPLRHGK